MPTLRGLFGRKDDEHRTTSEKTDSEWIAARLDRITRRADDDSTGQGRRADQIAERTPPEPLGIAEDD